MKSEVAFVDLSHQWDCVRTPFLSRLEHICAESRFVLSNDVAEFENAFAEYCEAAYCVGVNSGTDALTLALVALGVGPGDEVILPANTYVASAESVCHAGATPVLVDALDTTKSIDPKQVAERIGPHTRAIVAVHLFGNPAPMDELEGLAASAGVPLVEDASQAHGARYRGRRTGSLGRIAAFSFYPGKNLGAFGDGGAVVTSDPELEARVRRLRNHGGARKYEHAEVGWNSRLDGIQAAALLCKLPHLDAWNEARRVAAAVYARTLADVEGLQLPATTAGAESVHHLYPVELIDPELERDDLIAHLRAHGIGSGIHYPLPVHHTKAFAHLGVQKGSLPVAERTQRRHLSLPMHPALTESEIEQVADAVRTFTCGGGVA